MINNISNAIFVQGDLNKISDNFGNDFPKPNVVISGTFLIILIKYCKNGVCGMCDVIKTGNDFITNIYVYLIIILESTITYI